MDDPILETWRTHCRLQLALIETIAPEALADFPGAKGRSVGAIIAHAHNNRVTWLEVSAPDLMAGVTKIPKEQVMDKKLLLRSLKSSGRAIEALLARSLEAGGKIKAFKKHATVALGYFIAHESYHHGEIGMTLAQAGHPLDKKNAYALWEWDKA